MNFNKTLTNFTVESKKSNKVKYWKRNYILMKKNVIDIKIVKMTIERCLWQSSNILLQEGKIYCFIFKLPKVFCHEIIK